MAVICDSSSSEGQGSSPLKFLFLFGMAVALIAGMLASFSRHSDPSHDLRKSEQARLAVQDVTYKVNNWLRDPKTGPVLYCGIAIFNGGVKQYRLYDIASGWTFFFQDGAWSSAFPGKTPFQFLEGNPRGVLSYDAFDPSSNGSALEKCIEIFKKAPPPGSFR
jgi:hypothetical protein